MRNDLYRMEFEKQLTPEKEERDDNCLYLWNLFQKAEIASNLYMEDHLSTKQILEILSNTHISKLSYFKQFKTCILRYAHFLYEKGELSDVDIKAVKDVKYKSVDLNNVLDTLYIKDFQNLHDTIETSIQAAAREDRACHDTVVSAFYLAWCGVSIDDILDIQKADIKEDHVLVRGEAVYANPTIIDHLKRYRDSEGYYRKTHTIGFFNYKPSSYLFRTERSEKIPNVEALRSTISTFTKISKGENMKKILRYENVYLSGIFHRAYIKEITEGYVDKSDESAVSYLLHIAEDVDYLTRRTKVESYLRYLHHYYPSYEF